MNISLQQDINPFESAIKNPCGDIPTYGLFYRDVEQFLILWLNRVKQLSTKNIWNFIEKKEAGREWSFVPVFFFLRDKILICMPWHAGHGFFLNCNLALRWIFNSFNFCRKKYRDFSRGMWHAACPVQFPLACLSSLLSFLYIILERPSLPRNIIRSYLKDKVVKQFVRLIFRLRGIICHFVIIWLVNAVWI